MKFLKPSYRTPPIADKSGQRHLPVTGYPCSRNPGRSGEVLALSEPVSAEEAREFALAFRGFLDWVHATAPRERNEVSVLVRDFLGPEGTRHSVVTRRLPAFEHVNLQTAVDAWSARPGRTATVQGIAMPPGRVDVAVEIALPDAEARERLLTLYGQHVPLTLTAADIALAVERTDGTTASFIKELIRRSMLEALQDDPALAAVTGAHLSRALDDLLDASQAVTRTLLGVGVDPADLPAGGALQRTPPLPAMWGPTGRMLAARRIARFSGD